MQWSVRINEAYQRLKDPLKRAAYLCELNGAPIDAENNTAMPADFLMQQMDWREALDDAERRPTHYRPCTTRSTRHGGVPCRPLRLLIDEKGAFAAAAAQVRALMFIERFAQDVEAKLEHLGQ